MYIRRGELLKSRGHRWWWRLVADAGNGDNDDILDGTLTILVVTLGASDSSGREHPEQHGM